MAFKDLREWLDLLEKERELFRVTSKVDWDLEIGGIVQKVFDEGGPALLFENIQDHENTLCKKLFTASLSTRSRVALMLGLPGYTSLKTLIEVYRDRLEHPVKPVMLETGSVKENIVQKDDINLFEFPTPKWHHLDGGRFIGTFDGVVTRDPETGWTNVGLYRRQVHDEKTMGISIVSGQHIWMHFKKYMKMGKPMPVTIVCGWDPVLPAVACAPLPSGVNEYDVMGSLRQGPVELVKCETNDLLVPANAEIVFEGEVPTDLSTMRVEGPFGEYTGYYGSEAGPKPILHVTCITHRSDPILQGTLEGVPINEDHRIMSINSSATTWNFLEKHLGGIVTGVNVDHSTGWANVFVQVDNKYIGQPFEVASSIWSKASPYFAKNIMVVDTDIDIYDLNKIAWAFAYRVDPKKDFHIFPGRGSPTDPVVHPKDRFSAMPLINRLLIDATKPIHENPPSSQWHNERFAPVSYPDSETMKKVQERWEGLGLASFMNKRCQ